VVTDIDETAARETDGIESAHAQGRRYRARPGSAERIEAMLDELATISEPGEGVSRLAYTALERRAHQLFSRWMQELGLEVHTDAVGNTIAELPGTVPGLPVIGTGSHLDSVPGGGAFDGIVGVVCAVEVARTLVSNGDRTSHPLRFVAWAAEEGARFGQACLGSRLAVGLTAGDDLQRLRDSAGVTLAEAMSSVGFDPARAGGARWNSADLAAFVELHIEQGNVLERDGLSVGVVDVISGSTRIELELRGRASHTGGTPMSGRADALAAAAEIVLLVEQIATDAQHHGTRATVGRLVLEPGSITTIPGHVVMSVDVRDVDADRQRDTAHEIVRRARALAERRSVGVDARVLGDASPVILTAWLRELVAAAAEHVGIGIRTLVSGASHDVQMVSSIVPSALIFVRSRHGISHAPDEFSDAQDCVDGAAVLGQTLLEIDEFLTAQDRRHEHAAPGPEVPA
jgi:allantoate deiminase